MSSFNGLLSSSLGKKLLMSLTGFFLMLFLTIHLFGNIFIYVSASAFNAYVETLEGGILSKIILVIEFFLGAAFLIHIYNGIRLTLENLYARTSRYAVRPESPQSSFSSRNMWITASVIFIFLVFHLQNFWYQVKFGDVVGKTMYDIVTATLSDPLYASLYLAAVLILGFHLIHGFQSAFQSLGLNHSRYTPVIKAAGIIYALVISGGFISFPVYFFLKSLLER